MNPTDTVGKPDGQRSLSWVSISYFAEGLPWSLMHQVAAEFFTSIGARPAEIGRTALLHIPILLKVLFSPVVEGYLTLRRWMYGTQFLMGVTTGGVAVLAHRIAISADPALAESTWLWSGLFLIGILSALYDIACDGYYLEHLSEKQQAGYSGVRVAAYRIAMLLGSFLLVFLGGVLNWLISFAIGGGLLCLLAFVLRWILPAAAPLGLEGASRSEQHQKSPGWGAYASFFRQKSIIWVLAFLFFYKAADAMMFSMSSVLMSQKLGIATEVRAVLGVFSTVASIWGTVWGGAWIARRGFERALFPITLLMVITEPLYVLLAAGANHLALPVFPEETGVWDIAAATLPQLSVVTIVLIIEKLCAGLAVAAQMIFIMRRCHPEHKTAHYAFATVIYSVAQILMGSVSGDIFERVGPLYYYVIVSALAVPALLLAKVVPLAQRTTAEV